MRSRMKMTKICLLIVWMGKFPENFELWKKSVLKNPTIDFYVITDNKNRKDEANLKFVYMTFDEVRKRFQALFDFKIVLNTPYKLCDYKPVCGEAFYEITKHYDFWGHVDMDVLLGDIRAFLTEEILEKYDKLFEAGCFILYRNTEKMRGFYKKSVEKENMAYPYKRAFRCPYACYFDEYMGMNILDWTYDIRTLRDQNTENFVQDFSWKCLEFRSYMTAETFVFHWENGKLYRYLCDDSGKLLSAAPKEYMLVHIQKRKMAIPFSMEELEQHNSLWIVPNQYQLERPEKILYEENKKKQYAKMIAKSDRRRSLNNLKKFGIIAYVPHFFKSRTIRNWIVKKKGFF